MLVSIIKYSYDIHMYNVVNHTMTVLNQYGLLDNTVETIVHTVLILMYILCLYNTGVAQLQITSQNQRVFWEPAKQPTCRSATSTLSPSQQHHLRRRVSCYSQNKSRLSRKLLGTTSSTELVLAPLQYVQQLLTHTYEYLILVHKYE